MTSHDNVTDIVERDHIKETTETLFRIAINATMPKENEAKWCQALQYAGAMLEKQQADLATLRKQLENAREALHSIEGQAVCVALPHKASEADDMLENIAGIAALALESIYALKGQPC